MPVNRSTSMLHLASTPWPRYSAAAIWTNEQSQQRQILAMDAVQHVGNGIGACVVPIPYIEWFEEQPDR